VQTVSSAATSTSASHHPAPILSTPAHEDIPILADWFLEHLRADLNSGKLPSARGDARPLLLLMACNIRELRNVLERAALICHNG